MVHAGGRAAAHLRAQGLHPADIGCVPATAGGPKGLAPIPLDKRLFDPARGWLREAPHVELIGASTGARRMAAASMREPIARSIVWPSPMPGRPIRAGQARGRWPINAGNSRAPFSEPPAPSRRGRAWH